MSQTQQKTQVEQFWDDSAKNKEEILQTFWTSHPRVQQRLNKLVSGDPHIDPYGFSKRFLEERGVHFPVRRVGSLGCGTGELERGLAGLGIAYEFCGYDISPASVEQARKNAKQFPETWFEYEVADLNRPNLGEGRFDIVYATMSVHHIEKLEDLAAALVRALTPDGYLIMNEFVGPTRFQWTEAQLTLLNRVVQTLPNRLRTSVEGHIKSVILRETVEHMIEVDPSESVRSLDIIPVFKEHFDIVVQRDYGGTLLQMLLASIVHNFKGELEESILEQIFVIEDVAIESGMLNSDFTFIIMKPKRRW